LIPCWRARSAIALPTTAAADLFPPFDPLASSAVSAVLAETSDTPRSSSITWA